MKPLLLISLFLITAEVFADTSISLSPGSKITITPDQESVEVACSGGGIQTLCHIEHVDIRSENKDTKTYLGWAIFMNGKMASGSYHNFEGAREMLAKLIKDNICSAQ